MPRDGTGRSDNAIEPEHDIIHGAGDQNVSIASSDVPLASNDPNHTALH